MSSEYSNDLKCKEMEPIYYADSSRVEWRLQPNTLYTNNISIMNLGITKASGASRLNKLVGCYGTINRILLYDGNTELQVLTRASEWLGFKQHLHSNQYLEELASDFSGNKKASRLNLRDISNAQSTTFGAMGKKIIEGGVRPSLGEIKTTQELTFKGQLDLSEGLSMLQAIPYIDTSVFKNLKIILEFDMNEVNTVASGQDGAIRKQLRPYLVVEEVVAPDILESSLGRTPPAIPFSIIENDVFSVPAMVPTVNDKNPVQDLTFHVSSYNNKKVDRMVIMTRTVGTVGTNQEGSEDVGNGVYNSHAMLGQKNMVRVNGRNIFGRPIERDNQRLGLMADVWGGTASIAPFQNGLAFVAVDANSRQNYLDQGNPIIGTSDYFGCALAGVTVEDLQLDYQRMGIWNNDSAHTLASKYNSALELHIFCEIKKAIVFNSSGSGYNVVYV